LGLSPEGDWVVAETLSDTSGLSLVPTGAGEARALPRGEIRAYDWTGKAAFFPDGRRFLFAASGREGRPRLWRQGTDGTQPLPFGPEGAMNPVVSPDGRLVAVLVPAPGGGSEIRILDAESGLPRAGTPAHHADADLHLIRFAESSSLWVARVADASARIEAISLETGAVRAIREIRPADPAGVSFDSLGGCPVLVSADGRTYAATFRRTLGDLYLVGGLH